MNDKKQEIINTAIRLFTEKGFLSTTVEEIARESNIAKGSFYKHFESKEDLLIQLLLYVQEVISKRVNQIRANLDLSRKDKMIQLHKSIIETVLENNLHLLVNLVTILPTVICLN